MRFERNGHRSACVRVRLPATSIDGMVQDVKDLIDHLLGNHDNARCSKYAKCQQPDYRPSFEAKTIEETAVLKAWANKYGKRTVCMKYYRACNTKAEEALNAIMLFDKRLFSRDAARYDCCAYACALFLNERGWGFEQLLHEVIGHKLSTFSLYVMAEQEKKGRYHAVRRRLDEEKEKRTKRREHRSKDKHDKKTSTLHRDKVRHTELDQHGGGSGRKCGYCRQVPTIPHNARTCPIKKADQLAAAAAAAAAAAEGGG